MDNYWDSFECQIQCEEVYTEEPDLSELEEIMIEIITAKEANLVTGILPKENFEVIKPKLDELASKAQIELSYHPADKDPNKIYFKCLTTDTVLPIEIGRAHV